MTGLDFGLIGIAIIVIFLGSWAVSTLIYRLRGYDNLLATPVSGASDLRDAA